MSKGIRSISEKSIWSWDADEYTGTKGQFEREIQERIQEDVNDMISKGTMLVFRGEEKEDSIRFLEAYRLEVSVSVKVVRDTEYDMPEEEVIDMDGEK